MSSWDDDKTTADDPDNPSATEQLSAEEWNNHVADQKSRVLYGPLADRPSAGDVPNGTTYLITDLANDGGVLTKVVSGAWQIMQIGDASNRPDMFGGVIDANAVETDALEAESASVEEQSVKTSWQDETTNRDLDNWYQAPYYDIEVAVTPIVDEDNTTITANFNVNDEQSQQRIYRIRPNGAAEEFTRVGSAFSVPANHYYRVDISGDTDNVSLDIWFERR